MNADVESFYEHMKGFYSDIVKARTKTISTREFKDKAISTYETWKTKIEPRLIAETSEETLSRLDVLFEKLYDEARMRVSNVSNTKALVEQINGILLRDVVAPLRKNGISEPEKSLIDSTAFLGLDRNWHLATCALQLQEVAITLVAKRKGIKLDKTNIEKLSGKKIQNFSFNHQYQAFSKYVEDSYNIKMPILTTHLRAMRVKVLHEGYNPKPEETQSIASFTIGLLSKLEKIYNMR